jgi:hypothetical protein
MLHWHSPTDPKQTEIANITQILKPHLFREFQLDFVSEHNISKSTGLHVYNIGNFFNAHYLIWWNSIIKSGIVIMHDVFLQHLFFKIFNEACPGHWDKLEQIGSMLYGGNPDLHLHLQAVLSSRSASHESSGHFPFTELATFNAISVITHSEYAADQVRQGGAADTHCLHLPYFGPKVKEAECAKDLGKGSSWPINLAIFGFLGHNRFILETLKVLENISSPEDFHLHLIGPLNDKSVLSDLKRRKKQVTLHGAVFGDKLDKLLRKMDLGINIRKPSMGESSASLLRYWANGVPCVVARTKYYAELPGECVAFVEEGEEEEGLLVTLEDFRLDRELFGDKANSAIRRLTECHSPERYARDLFRIVVNNPELRERYKEGLSSKYASAELKKWEALSVD